MSRVEEMIERLCPDGVEYKALGGVAAYAKERIPATEVGKGCYVGVNELLQGYRGRSSEVHTPAEERCIAFHSGDVLLGNIRPYLKKMWLADCDGGTNGDVLVIRVNDTKEVAPEFLWQVLAGDAFTKYNIQHSKGAKMPRGDKGAILEAKIPVPPMEIQQEIVRMLDSFAELEAELEARRSQFDYYRSRLLSSTKSGTVTNLGAICSRISSGKCKVKSQDGKYPIYGSTGIIASTDSPAYHGDRLLVARVGANAGFVHQATGDYEVSDNTLILEHCQDVDIRYFYHVLDSANLNQYAKGGGQPLITAGFLKNFEISLPSKEEQQRIASILEKFFALVNDMTHGIPAEIDARRKQYAYYRDKLLSFREKVA